MTSCSTWCLKKPISRPLPSGSNGETNPKLRLAAVFVGGSRLTPTKANDARCRIIMACTGSLMCPSAACCAGAGGGAGSGAAAGAGAGAAAGTSSSESAMALLLAAAARTPARVRGARTGELPSSALLATGAAEGKASTCIGSAPPRNSNAWLAPVSSTCMGSAPLRKSTGTAPLGASKSKPFNPNTLRMRSMCESSMVAYSGYPSSSVAFI